jgi:hypothetical protein
MRGSNAAVKLPITSGVSRSGSMVMKSGCSFAASGPSSSIAAAIEDSVVGQMSGQEV